MSHALNETGALIFSVGPSSAENLPFWRCLNFEMYLLWADLHFSTACESRSYKRAARRSLFLRKSKNAMTERVKRRCEMHLWYSLPLISGVVTLSFSTNDGGMLNATDSGERLTVIILTAGWAAGIGKGEVGQQKYDIGLYRIWKSRSCDWSNLNMEYKVCSCVNPYFFRWLEYVEECSEWQTVYAIAGRCDQLWHVNCPNLTFNCIMPVKSKSCNTESSWNLQIQLEIMYQWYPKKELKPQSSIITNATTWLSWKSSFL